MDQQRAKEAGHQVERGGGDPIEGVIEAIKSGAMKLSLERLGIETITLDGSDFQHPLNPLVWAELGRTQSEFFVRHHEGMGSASHIVIPNTHLPVLGALVERVTWAERGRIPPPVLDAEGILAALVEGLLGQ